MPPFAVNTTQAAGNHNPNNSAEVTQPPADTVSSLCFSPTADFLLATSWDNQVRCWQVSKSGLGGNSINTAPKAAISHDLPVLCSAWNHDGTTAFSGGCDKQIKMWALLSGGQPVQLGGHDAPVKTLAWIPNMNILVSGSWDKTLKYWDLRQQNPVHTQNLPDRCYALSVEKNLMVVGTADRNVIIYNLQNPQMELKRIQSPLKYQTRTVAAFPDEKGFLIGSIEGRVGVHNLEFPDNGNKTYTFKCHRDATHASPGKNIYALNSLNFHPIHGNQGGFATAGSDGGFTFWDKENKQRLQEFKKMNQPITCSGFNRDGWIYAYAVGYDWSKGAENHNTATAKPHIFLHSVKEADIKPMPRTVPGRR